MTAIHCIAGGFLPGYFQGKRRAEEALASTFPGAGVALRPGFIYGTRQVGGVGIPLGAIGEHAADISYLSLDTTASVCWPWAPHGE